MGKIIRNTFNSRLKLKNRKGQQIPTSGLFFFMIIAFIGLIILGVLMYVSGILNGALSQNTMIGSVNLSNATSWTFGKFNSAVQTQSNTLGIITLFGMILGMLFNAFLYRDKNVRVFWLIDFILLIGAFILSLYLSNQYVSVISQLPFSSYYTSGLSQPTLFMTWLPFIIAGVGILLMIIGYSSIPKTKEEILAAVEP